MRGWSLWHGFGHTLPNKYPNRKAMEPNKERTRKLEGMATRMLLAGNLERYLHALRLLVVLRQRSSVPC